MHNWNHAFVWKWQIGFLSYYRVISHLDQKNSDWMIKQLSNKVITKCCDLSVSLIMMFCSMSLNNNCLKLLLSHQNLSWNKVTRVNFSSWRDIKAEVSRVIPFTEHNVRFIISLQWKFDPCQLVWYQIEVFRFPTDMARDYFFRRSILV